VCRRRFAWYWLEPILRGLEVEGSSLGGACILNLTGLLSIIRLKARGVNYIGSAARLGVATAFVSVHVSFDLLVIDGASKREI
jgi:hypothetical protein